MKLFFIEKGLGTPIVLLHGFPFDHSIWDHVVESLQTNFRVIAPDLRGAGKSIIEDQEFSIADMAVDVIHLLDKLSINKAIIAGHSMGGYVALDIASNFHDRVEGIALVSSHIYADTPEKRTGRLEMIARLKDSSPAQELGTMPKILSDDVTVQQLCRNYIENADLNGLIGSCYAMATRQSKEITWAQSDAPKCVVAGSCDQLISIEKSKKIANQGNNCLFFQIDSTGHMPMLENPHEVSKALETFIRSIEDQQ